MNNFSIDNNIIVDFSLFPFCFRCVEMDKFTNKLRDESQFFDLFKRLFEIDIPALKQYSFDTVVKGTNKHSHSISKNDKEYNLIINIIKELLISFYNYGDKDIELFFINNINEYYMWQLGTSSGIRLFGIRKSNVFSVLFIDYHHLVYPNKHYNHPNYETYKFCPMAINDKEDFYE